MKRISTIGFAFAAVLAGSAAMATLTHAGDAAKSAGTSAMDSQTRLMTIWRDPGCGCCDSYAAYMEEHGYQITLVDDPDFHKRSVAAGVPQQGVGCHLAQVDGYYVSGLVPADIVERLVTERPDITGITLPGMPGNAPGMAPQKTGILKTYAFGKAGISVYSNE